MGISDRDYMRKPQQRPTAPPPKARIRRAGNRPSLLERIRFWLWNLKNRK